VVVKYGGSKNKTVFGIIWGKFFFLKYMKVKLKKHYKTD